MKKCLSLLMMLFFMCGNSSAQSLTAYTEYFDFYRTQIKRKYHVLPDGTPHGKEQEYDRTGTLVSTLEFDNGLIKSFKYHYKDESINKQGDYLWLDTDETHGKYPFAKTYKEYNIQRTVIKEHKLYKQVKPDDLNEQMYLINEPDEDERDRYVADTVPIQLGDWRLESYMGKSSNGLNISFTTSSDKTKEIIKITNSNGVVEFDATYDIYKQTLIVRTSLKSKEYQLKNGELSILEPCYCNIGNDIYEYQPTKLSVGSIKIPMARSDFYNHVLKTEEVYLIDNRSIMVIAPNTEYTLSLSDIIISVDQSNLTKKFYGKAMILGGSISSFDNVGVFRVIEGDENSGVYEYKTSHVLIKAKYENGQYTSFVSESSDNTGQFRKYSGETVMANSTINEFYITPQQVIKSINSFIIYPHGSGHMQISNTKAVEVYDGEFVNGLYNGMGICKVHDVKSGDLIREFDGYWENGLFEKGVYKDYYTSSMYNNKWHRAHDEYEGEFSNWLYDGKGKLIIKSFNTAGEEVAFEVYEGEFKSGEFYSGNYNLNSVNIIKVGKYTNGQLQLENAEIINIPNYKSIKSPKSNTIEVLFSNGDTYIGDPSHSILQLCKDQFFIDICGPAAYNYLSSKEILNGKYVTSKGNIYDGIFADTYSLEQMPQRFVSGNIDVTTTNGRYVGMYTNGQMTGQGKVILNNGNVYEGTFSNGVLLLESPIKVLLTSENGDIYEGPIMKWKAHGKGEARCANGDYYKGAFQNGKFIGTGDVRVTTKNGVYEGSVTDNQCQQVGDVKKIPAYKIELPKESVSAGHIVAD